MDKILSKQFGDRARDDIQTLAAFSTDASQIKGDAVAVVTPASVEDIYRLIRYAHRTDTKITPRGAGTGLCGAAVPQNTIVLDMSAMDRVISIDKRNLVAVVEPGVVPEVLNDILGKEDLCFPVIPASYKACTIGGMISTNAAGLRAFRDGNMREWVVELEIIDGMGRLFRIKGDNIDNFCGKEGTTGIITKAKIRLAKPQPMRSLDMFKLDSVDEMLEVISSLDKSKVARVEYIDKVSARIAGFDLYYYLFVEYDDDTGQIFDEQEIEKTWDIRENAGVMISNEGFTLSEDPKLPLDSIPRFISWLEKHDIPSFGHIAEGIIHPRFSDSSLLPEMYRLVKELGGSVSGEHGIGLKKKEYVDEKTRAKVIALKKRYDPEGVLNPGKLI